jgi:phosphoesterase RecJ-like protein
VRESEVRAAQQLLALARTVLVISHVRPDGDGIGSLLALTRLLDAAGKMATPILADGAPTRFSFLPGAERIRKAPQVRADLIVAVDCSDRGRLGLSEEQLGGGPDLNFDHHATNTNFARVNLVEPGAAATAEVLYDYALAVGLPIDAATATCLLTGLVTDTVGFRTENVTPKVLRLAASLVELGAPLAEVYDRGLNRRTIPAARYWGRGLSTLGWDDGIVWASLTEADRRAADYAGSDDADLINLLTTLDGAQVALVFVEQPGGKVKVSWRSAAGVDVARLAQGFGGGGHEPAAGAMIEGQLEDVRARVLASARSFLHTSSGSPS